MHVRSAVPAAAALRDDRLLRNLRRGGAVDQGGSCHATSDCLSGLYCGSEGTCGTLTNAFPPFAGASCADEGPFRGYFEVRGPGKPPADFFRLPFPNDVRVSDAGALDISDFPKPGPTPLGVDLVKMYVDTWTTDFDGFSAAAAITFRFSGNIDYATTTADVVRLIDVTPGPTFGWEFSRSWVTNNGRTKYSCNHTLFVRNTADDPYQPDHTYAVLVTTGLKSDTGAAAAPDADFTAVMGGDPPDRRRARARVGCSTSRCAIWLSKGQRRADAGDCRRVHRAGRARAHGAARDQRRDAAAARADGAHRSAAGREVALRRRHAGARLPATADPAFTEIHGKFSVPIYQDGTAPTNARAGRRHQRTSGVPAVCAPNRSASR
jgi:hypothetical protein